MPCEYRQENRKEGRTLTLFDYILHQSERKQKKNPKNFVLSQSLPLYREIFFPHGTNPPTTADKQTPRAPASEPAWCGTAQPTVSAQRDAAASSHHQQSRTIVPRGLLQNWSQQAPGVLGSHMSNSAMHFSYSSRAVVCELASPLRSDLDPVIIGCAGSGGSDKAFSGSIWR